MALTVYALTIRDQLAELEQYGYVGIFLIQLAGSSSVVIPMPTAVASIIGGAVYNPIIVGIVAGTAATIGEVISYVTGHVGSAAVEDRQMYEWIKGWMDQHDLLVLFLMALIPNPFFDVAGIIAGMLKSPYIAIF